MNISIITVFDELYKPFLQASLIGRAVDQGLLNVHIENFFSQARPKERIDAPSFGHGAGMLIKPEIVEKTIEQVEKKTGKAYKIFFSPHGKVINHYSLQQLAKRLQDQKHILFVAGRYEGMDARVEEVYADEILSLGNFVLMGGDIPVMATIEGMLRFIPGVVGKAESVEKDSFAGPFVDYPEYTQPVEWHGMKVPEVIRSGDHAASAKWRIEKAAERTVLNHFNWLKAHKLTPEQKKLAYAYIPSHYAVLLHSNIVLPDGKEGTTSVTSLDIHDGARSARTYGLKGYYLVTPLQDQQKIVTTLIDFWKTGVGVEYNPHRHEAIKLVSLQDTLLQVVKDIEAQEGKKPLLIGTSAKFKDHKKLITFHQQDQIWQEKRPILFLFGTGNGIAPEVMNVCDYILDPIEGFTDFNHLSVRSAMAIVFDRWLGIQRIPFI